MRKLNQTFGNVAYGAFSDSNNYATETNNFGETAFGILNKSTIDPDNFTSRDVVKSSKATLFSIGNGTEEERKNVIEIKGNGDVYINGVAGYTGTDTDQAGNIAEEFQGVHDSIDELDRRADETDVEIGEINQHLDNVDSTLDSIHIQKDSDSDLIYTLIVDGEERGTINIPKDQFLEDVSYDPDTKELIFIFVTSDENNKEVRINIENLVDVYSAGNGLSLADGQFAIKLDPSTESYITVGADGLKISGLDSKFDTLTQKDAELDGRILTAETDIDALLSDLSALKGDGEGSIGNLILTAVDALKGGVSESYNTLKKIEDSIVSTNGKFDEYLPLTGGTLTGNLYIQSDSDAASYNGITFNDIEIVPLSLSSYQGDELLIHSGNSFYLVLASDGSEAGTGNPYGLRFQGRFGDIIWGDYDTGKGSKISINGFRIGGKSETDLLHAAGGTTTLKTINNNSLLGSGNIEVPTTENIQDITGSNTYTGANYISKETNLTDAVMQLDEEIKAVNDNVELEHANAEATYVKKAGDTMTGDLTVPNVKATKFIGPLQGNADTATKATLDAKGFNIASTYSKLDTTPFAGAGLYDAEHPTLTDWLSAHRSYIGTWKGSNSAEDWTNVISSRHRNGDDDGNTYGMYIANKLLGDGVGTLRWDQLIAGVWQGEKVILDSSNYTDYITNVDVSSSPLTGYQTSAASNEELFISDTDTVVQAIGKLEKAILDDEYVTSETFKMLNKYIGLPEELLGDGPSDGTLVEKIDGMIVWDSID